MSSESFTVDDLTITPLKQDYALVHPALGTVNETAFVGMWFPCVVATEKKSTIKDLLFLITSDRKKILANDSILKGHGWRLEYKPTKFKNRWSLDDVEAYLNGADVEPISVYDSVVGAWHKYLEFTDERDYIYHALWDIGTYFHFLFSAYAYAYHGGTTETGKSKALRLSSLIAFNAILSNNMSTSSIFRLIQNARATLLLDETERLSTRNADARIQEFRSILLSGYQRGGQAVYRVEKDKDTETQNIVPFDVYGPKRIANIQGLEDVVSNRCKITIQTRSINDAITKIEPDIQSCEWETLRGQLCILFLQHWKEVKACYDSVNASELAELDGREFELWKPIIALARFFDACNENTTSRATTQTAQTTLTALMIDLAKETAKQSSIESTTETGESILIQILLTLVQTDGYVSVKSMKEKMLEQFDEPQTWINTKWIGKTLTRLGFKNKRRVGSGIQYMMTVDGVKNIADRMKISVVNAVCAVSAVALEVLLKETKTLHRLTTMISSKCSLCAKDGRMDWQADLFDDDHKFLCDTCGLELQKLKEASV